MTRSRNVGQKTVRQLARQKERVSEATRNAIAFNAGSDSRIAGLPITSNPYGVIRRTLHGTWRRGWLDADQAFNGQMPPVKD